jgi:hypothetical protein
LFRVTLFYPSLVHPFFVYVTASLKTKRTKRQNNRENFRIKSSSRSERWQNLTAWNKKWTRQKKELTHKEKKHSRNIRNYTTTINIHAYRLANFFKWKNWILKKKKKKKIKKKSSLPLFLPYKFRIKYERILSNFPLKKPSPWQISESIRNVICRHRIYL